MAVGALAAFPGAGGAVLVDDDAARRRHPAGFLAGICLDVFNGSQLGQHALALSLLAYLAIRLHLLTRAKPIFEQSLLVLLALFVYEGVLWAVDGWSGQRISTWTRWVAVVTSAMCWPLIVGLLGRLHPPR